MALDRGLGHDLRVFAGGIGAVDPAVRPEARCLRRPARDQALVLRRVPERVERVSTLLHDLDLLVDELPKAEDLLVGVAQVLASAITDRALAGPHQDVLPDVAVEER